MSARRILAGPRSPQAAEILRLLHDNSAEAKKLGIFMIGKFRIKDLLPEVCDCLNIKGLETDAFSVLKNFGDEAESELERFYLASSGNTDISKTILRLLGKIKTRESRIFLFSQLWSNSRQLKELALKCLIESDFKASVEEKDKLHQLISETIGIMVWNLSARKSSERNNDQILREVMTREIDRWRSYLFDLLSVTYDRSSILKIKGILERETVESVNYALEIIDMVIDDAIKQKLIMLIDTVPDEEKLENLNQFYPVLIPEYNNLAEDIINRDYNLISIWTKACVLRSIRKLQGESLTESVVALLFSSEEILKEESARIIAGTSASLYNSVSQRLPESNRIKLDIISESRMPKEEFLYEKTRFLAERLPSVSEAELLSLAVYLKYFKDFNSLSSALTDNTIIWPVSENRPAGKVHIHYEGKLDETKVVSGSAGNVSYYLLALAAAEEFTYHYPESSFGIFNYIKNNEE
jgi:hypothetical protein